MDRHESVVGEFEHNHLEQVPGSIRPDDQHLGWIAVGIEVSHHKRMLCRAEDVLIRDAMSPRRPVHVHTPLM